MNEIDNHGHLKPCVCHGMIPCSGGEILGEWRDINDAELTNLQLEAKLKIAEEALEYYSHKDVYQCIDHGDLHERAESSARNFNHIPVYALDKKGNKARAALEK